MIELYGAPRTSAGRCYLMLEEVGQPYRAVPLDMFKSREHKAPAYLKLNPNGKVPCLVDGDVTLWESVAINQYLAERYKPELLGTDASTRGKVAQWNLWGMLELQPPLVDVIIETMMKPEPDRAVVERALAKLPGLVQILDEHLAGTPYLAGPEVTLADLNLLTVYNMTSVIRFPTSPFSHAERWFNALKNRPSVKAWFELRQAKS